MAPSFASPFRGYNCFGFDNGDDCHMLFVARSENRLYEIYHGTIDATDIFRAGCLAIWDTSKVSDNNGRGQQCTSADAAGFPIAPLLFTAEEVQAGTINHAIRFILPNNMIRMKKYVAPATHGTSTTGPATAIPYGGHMRLKSSFSVAALSPAGQVVARALQKYGMYMADGGNIALTAQSDALGRVKWSDVGFDSNSLSTLKATDFDVIDHGATTDVTNDCQRPQIGQ
jgi:serine/threonine-protein kinase